MEQAEFWQKQAEIQAGLAGAVIESIPEDWYTAELTLGPMTSDDDSQSMSHELNNPQLTAGVVSAVPKDQVYIHTRELELLFREFGTVWAKATFRVSWEEADEQWRFVMEYEYGD